MCERVCACGCNNVFSVKLNKSRKYFSRSCVNRGRKQSEVTIEKRLKTMQVLGSRPGRKKGTPASNRVLRETRSCLCGCNTAYICKVNSKKRYINGHHSHTKSTRYKISRTMQGKNCYAWKGGISPLHEAIRFLFESIQWRTQVFERDNYTCQECFKRGVLLEVHHLKPFTILFKEFLQHYSQFSPIEDREVLVRLATTWTPFWEVLNGKTLCNECHNVKRQETYQLINQYKEV